MEQIITADGFAADERGGLEFFEVSEGSADSADDEQLEFLKSVDAILLGATTYRMFADFWPTADPVAEPVTEPINRLPKYVLSGSLDAAPWGNEQIEILRPDAVSAVRTLKGWHEHIVVWGSLTLTDELFARHLVDRLRLRMVPALLGTGRRFTPTSLGLARLHLDHVQVHPSGQVTLDYRVR